MNSGKHTLSLRLAVLTFVLIAAAAFVVGACASDPEAEASDAAQKYLAWTKADWDSADAAEKTAAAEVVVRNLEQSLRAAFGTDAEASATAENGDLLHETAEQMVEDIDVYFQGNSNATLQDLIDDTLNLLGIN